MDHNTKQDKGFTLVELLIVIVILGILATVTVFAVRGITDQGQTSACEATEKTYEVAIEAWYALPAGDRDDSGANAGHPSGPELEATELVRSYDGSDVEVIEGNGAVVSSTGATAGASCVGLI